MWLKLAIFAAFGGGEGVGMDVCTDVLYVQGASSSVIGDGGVCGGGGGGGSEIEGAGRRGGGGVVGGRIGEGGDGGDGGEGGVGLCGRWRKTILHAEHAANCTTQESKRSPPLDVHQIGIL